MIASYGGGFFTAFTVVPDDPQNKGSAWPWALVSLGWHPKKTWELAAALESASTPEHTFEFNALARFALFLEKR